MNSTKADMLVRFVVQCQLAILGLFCLTLHLQAKPVHGDAEWTIGQLPTNNFDDTANPHQTVPWHDLVASHTVAPTQSNEWTQGLAAISQFYDANDNGMYQVRGTDYPPHQEQSFSDQLFDQSVLDRQDLSSIIASTSIRRADLDNTARFPAPSPNVPHQARSQPDQLLAQNFPRFNMQPPGQGHDPAFAGQSSVARPPWQVDLPRHSELASSSWTYPQQGNFNPFETGSEQNAVSGWPMDSEPASQWTSARTLQMPREANDPTAHLNRWPDGWLNSRHGADQPDVTAPFQAPEQAQPSSSAPQTRRLTNTPLLREPIWDHSMQGRALHAWDESIRSVGNIPPGSPSREHVRGRARTGMGFVDDIKSRSQAFHVWEESIKRALGMKDLKIDPVDPMDPGKGQVMKAQSDDVVKGYHPPVSSPVELAELEVAGAGHVIGSYQSIRRSQPSAAQVGDSGQRVYIYLNSRNFLDFLRKKYFRDKIYFLPIKEDQLHRALLTDLRRTRRPHYVLPPKGRNRLSLVMIRHDPPRATNGRQSSIERLTGHSDQQSIVSLWSPILYDGNTHTSVLYGVGKLDTRHGDIIASRLRALQSGDPEMSAFYDLRKTAH
ncbi:uncharacterized protein MEPE_04223 [Melanopsichium pennsylvanicum]|uniref:Uncharacterized protein n=1 Tax=Melanopsichium pennsylvanicum TaxID=63383 RepID=A0AAJ5C6I0_9BASI|nr:uncharacterized protein MEPE_04223 [Melanopsichium pennsylvanicum]